MIYNDAIGSVVNTLLKAWQRGEARIRVAIVSALILLLIVFLVMALHDPVGVLEKKFAETLAIILGAVSAILFAGVLGYQGLIEEQAQREKIEIVEERVREHPEKPQFAWDLARTKLESYLDRNLAQVRSIFWLTLLVMLCGFAFVLYGLLKAFETPETLPVSIVASASGVLISFIGGSFLLVYRSILAQSKEYVTVLERINAVGMAVQVIANIPDESSQLKHQTTAELAKQLLTIYAATAPSSNNAKASKG
jgi:hypothetical protein